MLRIRSWPGVANFFRKLQARGVPQPVLLNHFLKLTAEHIHLASGVIPHTGSSIGLNRVAPDASGAADALNRIITDGLVDLNEAEDFPRPHSLLDPQSVFPYACLGPSAVSVNQLVTECDIYAD
jgi:hypothetical protein